MTWILDYSVETPRRRAGLRNSPRERRTKSADFSREQGHNLFRSDSISVASSQLDSSVPATRSIAPLQLAQGYDPVGVHVWLNTVPPQQTTTVAQQQKENDENKIDNDNEMSKQSTLPTGRAFAPAFIPQYITSEQQQSSDSVDSQDSVRTQIPLPYHLQSDASHGQNQSYGTTNTSGQLIGNIVRSWGTPDLSGTTTFGDVRSGASSRSSRSLNPNSAPYVPPGYPPGFQSYNDRDSNAAMTSPFQQPAQLGGMSYQPNNAFAQGQVSGGVQLQGPYSSAPAMNPYAHFGSVAGMNNYNGYNAGIGLPMNPYAASNGVSPAMSHASLAPAQPTYQSIPYGPGTGAGVNPPTGYAPAQTGYTGANQGWTSMYNPQPQYQAQPPVQMYINPANAHRGKPPYPSGRQSFGNTGIGYGHPTSNLATAHVLSAAGKENVKMTSTHKEKFGAPVIPPSKAARLDASPAKSIIETFRTRTASPERRSDIYSEAAPTLGQKTQPLDLEFSSEPRNTATPTLRSRRGQTITNAVTDPSRKQVTSNWLDNIPNLTNIDSQGSNMQAQSPPKMLSLLGSGAGDAKALSTINENDPFVGPPRSRAATVHNNPFAPKPQASPYAVGNRLIGPPSGPSPHLRALTSGGTRYPSLEEAFDPANFPFVEICRLATEQNFGVIKIRNVSCLLQEVQQNLVVNICRSLMVLLAPRSLHSLVAMRASSMSKSTSQFISSWSVLPARLLIAMSSSST